MMKIPKFLLLRKKNIFKKQIRPRSAVRWLITEWGGGGFARGIFANRIPSDTSQYRLEIYLGLQHSNRKAPAARKLSNTTGKQRFLSGDHCFLVTVSQLPVYRTRRCHMNQNHHHSAKKLNSSLENVIFSDFDVSWFLSMTLCLEEPGFHHFSGKRMVLN